MRRPCTLCILLSVAAALSACNNRADMRTGSRIKPMQQRPGEPSPLATGHPPPGAVARDISPMEDTTRPPVTMALLERGRVQFDVYCAPCHARDGYGDGIIPRHGFPPPPNLHTDPVRSLNDEHYFAVITNGLGKMPSYETQVAPPDRWAIVAYIRALQLSQSAPRDTVLNITQPPPPTQPMAQAASHDGGQP